MLHAAGERATTARLDVLGVLATAAGHLGVAEIHRRVEQERAGTNLSTVYRTVDRLTELGLAHVVLTGGEATYGLAIEEHHHVVCDRCGITTSIAGSVIADLLTELGRRAATAVRTVEIHGVCADCSANPNPHPHPHPHPDQAAAQVPESGP
jgi:Fur family ferric uptake transcriptional regulator